MTFKHSQNWIVSRLLLPVEKQRGTRSWSSQNLVESQFVVHRAVVLIDSDYCITDYCARFLKSQASQLKFNITCHCHFRVYNKLNYNIKLHENILLLGLCLLPTRETGKECVQTIQQQPSLLIRPRDLINQCRRLI